MLVRKLLDDNFEVVEDRSTADEVTIICPNDACGDRSGNRSVNLKSGLTNCWKCGKWKGPVAWLFRDCDVEYDEASLDSLDVEPDAAVGLEESLESVAATPAVEVDLPTGFTRMADDPNSAYSELIGQMAVRKHLTKRALMAAGVGFTKRGSWEPYAIFPVIESGVVVYYQGRTYGQSAEGGKTKKFPSKKVVPNGASHWVYNFDKAARPETQVLIIVESMLNAISLELELARLQIQGVVPVAVFKHAVSKVQFKKLAALQPKECCFMYDGDATEAAWHEAATKPFGCVVSIAEMPVGTDANDDVQLALDRFGKRRPYSALNQLEAELDGL